MPRAGKPILVDGVWYPDAHKAIESGAIPGGKAGSLKGTIYQGKATYKGHAVAYADEAPRSTAPKFAPAAPVIIDSPKGSIFGNPPPRVGLLAAGYKVTRFGVRHEERV